MCIKYKYVYNLVLWGEVCVGLCMNVERELEKEAKREIRQIVCGEVCVCISSGGRGISGCGPRLLPPWSRSAGRGQSQHTSRRTGRPDRGWLARSATARLADSSLGKVIRASPLRWPLKLYNRRTASGWSLVSLQTEPLFGLNQTPGLSLTHLNHAAVVFRRVLVSLEEAEDVFDPGVVGQTLHPN